MDAGGRWGGRRAGRGWRIAVSALRIRLARREAADRARAAPGGEHTPGGAPPAAARSGATWLYFGCRREEEDYLYREELEGHLAEGTLTRLRLAFSRAQAAKVYVQHRIREDAAELWEMLQRGGA